MHAWYSQTSRRIADIAAEIYANAPKIDLVEEELLRLSRCRSGSETSLERMFELVGPEPKKYRVDLHMQTLGVGRQRLWKLKHQKAPEAQNLEDARYEST